MQSKIIAIIPAYNEEKGIERLLKETKKYVNKVIVVTDGSTDNTDSIAKKNGALVPKPSMRRGKGNALIKGIEFSRSFSPKIIIFMDADGEHEPSQIPKLLSLLKENDFVVGQRLHYRSKQRRVVNKINNFWVNLILPNITDVQCGFRAIKFELLKKMNLTSQNFQIEQEMLLEAVKNKARIKGVYIGSRPKLKSNLKFLDYIQINNFFDKWVIKNYKYLDIPVYKKIVLLPSTVVGFFIGTILERIYKITFSKIY